MVRAEHNALIAFTRTAACILSPNIVKMRAKSWKVGFPGGCPTSSLYDDAINSPQSQNDAVGSIVLRYVNADTTKANAAAILFHRLNFFSVITRKDNKSLSLSLTNAIPTLADPRPYAFSPPSFSPPASSPPTSSGLRRPAPVAANLLIHSSLM